jgi:hypothetical protein
MREITTKVYTFDELDSAAKERARQWWRECENETFGGFGEFNEPIETAARILGIQFHTHDVPLMSGKSRIEPDISWQLHVQGSGASFSGFYSYARGCAKNIHAEFPQDTELHAIADGLTAIQKKHGYRLHAEISTNGRDVHKYAMAATATIDTVDQRDADEETTEVVLDLMRDFADWIYRYISDEYDYLMTDEHVDDAIRANEYEFTVNGKRAA